MSMQAWREGGTGGDSSTPTQPGLFPYYLEGGTPNTVGIAGLAAGLNMSSNKMARHCIMNSLWCRPIVDKLGNHPKVRILGTCDARKRVGTVSLLLEGYEPADVGSILDDSFDIAVRPGLSLFALCPQAYGERFRGVRCG
ncbi:MAG: aminotransferase class V-fold PLP-dependent enzyme [Phycisphaerales bacterium]|nr:aminotransferase class V-fold PLP-dependent enzyme [Phycisphaerales bacterium]